MGVLAVVGEARGFRCVVARVAAHYRGRAPRFQRSDGLVELPLPLGFAVDGLGEVDAAFSLVRSERSRGDAEDLGHDQLHGGVFGHGGELSDIVDEIAGVHVRVPQVQALGMGKQRAAVGGEDVAEVAADAVLESDDLGMRVQTEQGFDGIVGVGEDEFCVTLSRHIIVGSDLLTKQVERLLRQGVRLVTAYGERFAARRADLEDVAEDARGAQTLRQLARAREVVAQVQVGCGSVGFKLMEHQIDAAQKLQRGPADERRSRCYGAVQTDSSTRLCDLYHLTCLR